MDMQQMDMAMVKALLARVPMILKICILHALSLSPASGKQDLSTELRVNLVRSFMSFEVPVGKVQRGAMKDPGIKGRMWISKVKMPRPAEDEVLQSLIKAIEHHKEGDETYKVPDLIDVEAEWTGYRSGVDTKAPLPDISEEEKYKRLMDEVKEDVTVLYFHGGAYYLMDPCTHRGTTTKLAKLTGGRCFSVRYRLAPQNPFPAAVLDALVAYLYLLSPPEGSLHAPVPANKIVVAGDSAGGGLTLCFLQTLLTLRRMSPNGTVRFHGKDVPIELPAGVAPCSPWCDVTLSLPSGTRNVAIDFLPQPAINSGSLFEGFPYPPDSAWPASPPRAEMYADANILTHPLVSPLAGSKDIWKDAPPMFFTVGEEVIEDDTIYLARKINETGTTVVVEHFDGQPHCFAMLAGGSSAARRSMAGWANFCLDAVHGRVKGGGTATYMHRNLRKIETRKISDIGELSEEEVQAKMKAGRDWRVEGERHLVNIWEQGQGKAKL
ncbi:hypothetical protein FQN50_003437 [Emmonsiellopsis sp. PD_5]|nr:hypothetical protein FQN50_003437 [Emmonsiellopsis sp. PD_5]